jgi:Zn-dependent protease
VSEAPTSSPPEPATRLRFTKPLWVVLGVAATITFLIAPGIRAFVEACIVILVLLASVAAHELGHVLMARRLGFHVTTVQLGVLDSATAYEGEHRSAPDRVLCALAGPALSVALAVAFGLVAWVLEAHDPLAAPFATFAVLNVVLAAANLIPFRGTDGWEIVQGLRGLADD